MTENEWLGCTCPQKMLEFLEGKVSERKLRLFACACCRHIWYHFEYYGGCHAVQVAERYADGAADKSELRRAHRLASPPLPGRMVTARRLPWQVIVRATSVLYGQHAGEQVEWKCSILRDIFHSPFRPVALDPAWQPPAVLSLAQAAYENRRLPSGALEPNRLVILADALEEAGCDNADIMSHLRQPGEHVKGCWVVDQLLGKE